jgi:hypothetical protein
MSDIVIEVLSKSVAAALILFIRYCEKTAIVKRYKKKLDDILNNES